MTTSISASESSRIWSDPARRHDFVYLFDVADGNPNGDPDAGNLPRVDPETMQGLVTDVAIKRKVRDWVDATRGTDPRFKIYVQNKGIALNDLHSRGYSARSITPTGSRQKREDVELVRGWMCDNFFDIRTFGAVMTTQVNAGQVRGPVQLTFSRSIDPIVPLDVAITRVAITDPEDAKVSIGESGKGEGGKITEIGRKSIVLYGLYRGYGFFNPHFAEQTRFSAEDLDLFWGALTNMWDLDHSAARGRMGLRGLYIFSHESKLGNGPAHSLLDRIRVKARPGVVTPRAFEDYQIDVNAESLPSGVTLTRFIG
jgi:CRISPR-associated protein Csd2